MSSSPLPISLAVDVAIITYNHESFIRQAIDGVLAQKTTFPIRLVIGEDCSTDTT
ncbi:glycosyltransferase [Hymenobacter sp. P5252]|uniref:Glycosyltransferase n=1 Tax=Hymenobacter terrestris TaxID=2748310 RepID=A0ABX2Q4N8_9BACT|nr:glycosyltransferase [Hymenobacter terrestris]